MKKMRFDSMGQFQMSSKAIVTASYAVALRIARTKNPHNIGETLIKPCLVECADILLSNSAASKMSQVSLSNNLSAQIYGHVNQSEAVFTFDATGTHKKFRVLRRNNLQNQTGQPVFPWIK